MSREDLELVDRQRFVIDSVNLNDSEGMLVDLEGVVRITGLETCQFESLSRD